MKKSLKAALLSGFIFPGLGQITLKHYKRGIIIMLTLIACLSIIIMKAVKHALTILDNFQSEDGEVSLNSISNIATQASTSSDNLTINFVLLLAILCWIISIVDAYRIGKKKEIEETSAYQTLKGNDKLIT